MSIRRAADFRLVLENERPHEDSASSDPETPPNSLWIVLRNFA
jgi:hypothetical protein